MRAIVVLFVAIMNLFLATSLSAFDNSELYAVNGCFVDSCGQVDSTIVKLLKSMEGDKFLIRTLKGKELLARISITEQGIKASWRESKGITNSIYCSEHIQWREIVLLENRGDPEEYGISFISGVMGVALLTAAVILLIPTIN